MLRSAAPPRTIQTLTGLLMAKVCDESACVFSQVELDAAVYDDNTWFVAYWDPSDLTRRSQAGGTERCEADAMRAMFAAIGSLTPVRS